jgi:hypothetical protein
MMRRKTLLVIGLMLALLTACIAPAPAAPGEQAASEETMSEHEHSMGGAEQLGTVDFAISCTPAAQSEFNHAVAMLHSFWFAPAIESFNRVSELDPTCGMGHWGVAMSLRNNPFSPPSAQALEDGWAAVEQAQAAGAKTPREEAYIAAIAAFYQDAATVDHRTRAEAHTQAMEQIVNQYPEDQEAKIFYAIALDASASPTDKSYANQLKAAALLEEIFVEQPNHPGIAHYLIHSYDYPALAEQGLGAAQRYAGIAPDAPHALHMPSHIFTRRGLWQESIDTNINSARTANEEITAAFGPGTGSGNELHAYDYMMYAYLQLGQDGAAQKVLDKLQTIQKLNAQDLGSAYALAAIPARYALERNQWAEAAMLDLQPSYLAWEMFPQAEAVRVFARGLGAARSGDVIAAQQNIERLEELREAMLATNNAYWAEQAAIQIQEIAAWSALAEGKNDEALALMRQAVAMEDATEKHPVTPGPLKPAHELLGEILLALDEPAQALAEFEASQQIEPNRFMGLYGAARAAELAGEMGKAHTYYEQLVALGEDADSERPELAMAQAFLAQN